MKNIKSIIPAIVAVVASLLIPQITIAEDLSAKSIILVHGAFSDASSWNKVIPILKNAGLEVIAVQNPLDSLEGDVEFTNRAIERAKGPVVLVGHSWAGAVITEAGNNDKVQSLVYVAAYAPSVGQTALDETNDYPKPEGFNGLVADKYGYVTLSADAMKNDFASDLSNEEISTMWSTQGALNTAVFGQKITKAAWTHKPNWYAISENDQMIHPDQQIALVKKINATFISLQSSHVSMLSQPDAIADLIIRAAK